MWVTNSLKKWENCFQVYKADNFFLMNLLKIILKQQVKTT